jgi:hypothetical protein
METYGNELSYNINEKAKQTGKVSSSELEQQAMKISPVSFLNKKRENNESKQRKRK